MSIAVSLELIREESPSRYVAAAIDFVRVLSSQPGLLNELTERYLTAGTAESQNGTRVRNALQAEQKEVERIGAHAPFVLYRGRLLQRIKGESGEPFDPLRDDTNLLTTMAIIRAESIK